MVIFYDHSIHINIRIGLEAMQNNLFLKRLPSQGANNIYSSFTGTLKGILLHHDLQEKSFAVYFNNVTVFKKNNENGVYF